MNENIDLTKILKDCPKGWELYSPIWGKVLFGNIQKNEDYPVHTWLGSGDVSFSREGKFYNAPGCECCLFPSKEQRDWSKFAAPWYKKERFDPKTLEAFDKVLVRDKRTDCWRCEFYSHLRKDMESTKFKYAATAHSYARCIPYNEDTKHLVGTTDEAPEFYRYWED